ncbi:unnamed protein product [Didymodactylos carnosus]|uniref:Uncharacterized protein n=1 Tax=Didymodactylos carnosus TaxID=1234261 RepID=A0A8S2GTY3_9BILA|nr:unnamed protein product [Didymodactylos carnosus]CAF3561781.1 unnamed protein product [Didymodactylos carnosus]
MKRDAARMSLDEILKKVEEAEIQLLYRRKEEIQRSLPNRWISTTSDCDKDEGIPHDLTTSLTPQRVRLKTPERTVVVAKLDAPSFPSTNFSGQETQIAESSVFPTNNDRNRPTFSQNRQTNFYERNNNNSGGRNSNNNSSRLPFSSNNSPNFNRSNPSAANRNREPPGPCPICRKNGHWRNCRIISIVKTPKINQSINSFILTQACLGCYKNEKLRWV